MLLPLAFVLFATSAHAAPRLSPPVRLLTAEVDPWMLHAPSVQPLLATLQQRQAALETSLQPLARRQQELASPKTPAEVKAKEKADKALEVAVAKAKTELDDLRRELNPKGLAALRSVVSSRATASHLDYMLDVGAVIWTPAGPVSWANLEYNNPSYYHGFIATCRVVQVDLATLDRDTAAGRARAAALESRKQALLASVASGELISASGDQKWTEAVSSSRSAFGDDLAKTVAFEFDIGDDICVVDSVAAKSGLGTVLEPKRGALVRAPDLTRWAVENLDAARDRRKQADSARLQRIRGWREAIDPWQAQLKAGVAEIQGAVVPPPAGWTSAWRSTRPFPDATETLVGIDSEGHPRLRAWFGRGLELRPAELTFGGMRESLHDWVSLGARPWECADLDASELPPALDAATLCAAVADGARADGTLLVEIQAAGKDRWDVVLDVTDAQIPLPVAEGAAPP